MLATRLSADGSALEYFDGVHLGVATELGPRPAWCRSSGTPRGCRSASSTTRSARLAEAARSGRIDAEQLSGSTFTLNNYGTFGVDGAAPIINHPEVAILGIGRMIERAWVVDGQIVPRRIAQVSLVFDHRVCDGGYASGFLRAVVDAMEHPLRLYRQLWSASTRWLRSRRAAARVSSTDVLRSVVRLRHAALRALSAAQRA